MSRGDATSGFRVHPAGFDPRIDVDRVEADELAEFAERDATLFDQSTNESGADAHPISDLVHVEQGTSSPFWVLSLHVNVKASASRKRDKHVNSCCCRGLSVERACQVTRLS